MSDIVMNVSFPLDGDGFFRRECPLCVREFKIRPTPSELQALASSSTHALLSADEASAEEARDTGTAEYWCPYCGQQSAVDTWWTEEQLAYLKVVAGNVAAQLINEHLLAPLRRTFSRSRQAGVSLEFRGRDMEERDAWIAPEPNDLVRFALPCCGRELKLDPEWDEQTFCYFCGFPHPAR